jgi:hypothetical protein
VIQILNWFPRTTLGNDPATLAEQINEMADRGGRAANVKCTSLTCGDALVLYAGTPDGDGAALDAELRAALLAEVESC